MLGLHPIEIVLLGAVAVMLYGKRLPEVGRTVGKTVGDLRRQWTQLTREFDVAAHVDARGSSATGGAGRSSSTRRHDDDVGLVAGPRFEPPEGDG